MISDLIQLISHYLDIDEIYRVKELLNLNVNMYLKYVKCPTGREISYLNNLCCCNECFDGNSDNSDDEGLNYCVKEFCWAIHAGYLEVVKYLDPGPNYSRVGIMHLVLKDSHLEILKYLRSKEYKLSSDFNMFLNGELETLKYLESINTPIPIWGLRLAISGNQLEMVKYLDLKLKVNYDPRYVINLASEEGKLDILKYFYEEKGESLPKSAINLAISNNHLDVVEYLSDKNQRKVRTINILKYVKNKRRK